MGVKVSSERSEKFASEILTESKDPFQLMRRRNSQGILFKGTV